MRMYLQNNLSEEERVKLFTAITEDESIQWDQIMEQVKEEWIEPNRMSEHREEEILKSVLLAGQLYHEKQHAPAGRLTILRKWGWVAAASVILASIATFLLISQKEKTSPADLTVHQTHIRPGQEGALLTLADGSQVLLDTAKNATIALQGSAIVKVEAGVLKYEGHGNEVVYNKMSTPKGRQYQVILPDGTQVWLNSASTIRYPTIFTGNEREVEISGEAYLEVTKNSKSPFTVITPKSRVSVLGTSFNINAYPDEEQEKTTLIEGSVKINSGNEQVLLKPGQAATVKEDIAVSKADIEQDIAWKNGLFNFEGMDLKTVMRQLERWYDITVKYEEGIGQGKFRGKLSRDLELSQVIRILERMEVKFKLEGRILTVSGIRN